MSDDFDIDRMIAQTQALAHAPRIRVEKLIRSGKPRVRRDATFPTRNFDFTLDDVFSLKNWKNYKRENLGPYEMVWRWTRSRRLIGDSEEDWGVRDRSFYGVIRHENAFVGAVQLSEYSIPAEMEPHEFLFIMDDHSQETADLGKVVTNIFDEFEFEILTERKLLHWKSAWMHPAHARGAVWATLTNRIIAQMRGWSILILKAFPLEYQDGGSAKGFWQRQHAMQKYYQKVLGVEPVRRRRSRDGMPEQGWMLRWNPTIFAPSAPRKYGI